MINQIKKEFKLNIKKNICIGYKVNIYVEKTRQNPFARVKVGLVKVIIKEYFKICVVFIEKLLINKNEFMLDNITKVRKTIKKNNKLKLMLFFKT